MILKRGLLRIALAALLLAAQHGALTHQLGHLHDRLPAQEQQQDDDKKAAAAFGLCAFHVAFAEILGAIGSTTPPSCFTSNGAERSTAYSSFAFPVHPVVPASRGPPALL